MPGFQAASSKKKAKVCDTRVCVYMYTCVCKCPTSQPCAKSACCRTDSMPGLEPPPPPRPCYCCVVRNTTPLSKNRRWKGEQFFFTIIRVVAVALWPFFFCNDDLEVIDVSTKSPLKYVCEVQRQRNWCLGWAPKCPNDEWFVNHRYLALRYLFCDIWYFHVGLKHRSNIANLKKRRSENGYQIANHLSWIVNHLKKMVRCVFFFNIFEFHAFCKE